MPKITSQSAGEKVSPGGKKCTSARLSIRLPRRLRDQLDELAARDHRKTGAYARILLANHVKQGV